MPQSVFGQQPIRSDVRNMLPLIIKEINLKELITAADTDIQCNSLPSNATVDSMWLVIDPYTAECEMRKPSAIDGLKVTVTAMAYDHAAGDSVFVLTNASFDVEWWGAVGDGTTDDRTALTSAIAQIGSEGGGTLMLGGQRTYVCLGNIPVAYSNVTIRGHGSGSVIKFTHQDGSHGIVINAGATLSDNGVYDLAIYRNNNQSGTGDAIHAVDTSRFTASGVQVY